MQYIRFWPPSINGYITWKLRSFRAAYPDPVIMIIMPPIGQSTMCGPGVTTYSQFKRMFSRLD